MFPFLLLLALGAIASRKKGLQSTPKSKPPADGHPGGFVPTRWYAGRIAGKKMLDRPQRTVNNRRAILQTLMRIAWQFTPGLGLPTDWPGSEGHQRKQAEYQKAKRLLENARTHRQLSIATRNLVGMYSMPLHITRDEKGMVLWGFQQLLQDIMIAMDVDREDPEFADNLMRFAGSRAFEPQPTKGQGENCEYAKEGIAAENCQTRLRILKDIQTRDAPRIAEAILEWVPRHNYLTLNMEEFFRENSWFGTGMPTWEGLAAQVLTFALAAVSAYTGASGNAVDLDSLIPKEVLQALSAIERTATDYARAAGVDPQVFAAGLEALRGDMPHLAGVPGM